MSGLYEKSIYRRLRHRSSRRIGRQPTENWTIFYRLRWLHQQRGLRRMHE